MRGVEREACTTCKMIIAVGAEVGYYSRQSIDTLEAGRRSQGALDADTNELGKCVKYKC